MKNLFSGLLLLVILSLIACKNDSKKAEEATSQDNTTIEVSPELTPGPKPYDLDNMKGSKLVVAGDYGVEADQLNRLISTSGQDVTVYAKSNGVEVPFELAEGNTVIHPVSSSGPWEGTFKAGVIYSVIIGPQPQNTENNQFSIHVQKR